MMAATWFSSTTTWNGSTGGSGSNSVTLPRVAGIMTTSRTRNSGRRTVRDGPGTQDLLKSHAGETCQLEACSAFHTSYVRDAATTTTNGGTPSLPHSRGGRGIIGAVRSERFSARRRPLYRSGFVRRHQREHHGI